MAGKLRSFAALMLCQVRYLRVWHQTLQSGCGIRGAYESFYAGPSRLTQTLAGLMIP